MTLDIHNLSSTVHQELHKIVKDEIFPIVNQVYARHQNFEIQFLKEAAKFVRDFKSLANEVDKSLAKHKALEFEIERLLRAVDSQDILLIVQLVKPSLQCLKNNFVLRQLNAFQSKHQFFSKTRVPPKVFETDDLSNPVTSNSVPITKESKVVKDDIVIAPGMFRINPFKTYREEKFVPANQANSSVMTNPITVSQPHVITKKDVNSN
ncbi:hypothetical protein Tco_1057128 [Tanacetum coccineum]|uniref:FRIGIDA-like protein n=1 Tax=Tanacetum coccineum TaxID=301880 RepID=A0ABQ5H4Q5_9ASTR